MKSFVSRAFCGAVILAFSMSVAFACGDKLSAIGGGVAFDRLSQNAVHGNVVLLVEPKSSLRAANNDLNLKRDLEFAGHKVRTVDSTAALESLIAQGKTDVVLVSWQDAARLQTELTARSDSPAIVSVAYQTETGDATFVAPQGQCVAQAGRRKGRDVVEVVGHAMQQHKASQPLDCSVARTASKS